MKCSVLNSVPDLLSWCFDMFCGRNAERRRAAYSLSIASESGRNLSLVILPLGRRHRGHQFRQALHRISPTAPRDFGVV